ncbi:hypothetical protein DPMN_048192 [Dreissena polymorpha]|uniref:Uncharacterized protein n=1 Tax=Dreissena polymorpha TaxID=45954 RepID=A0A9D4DA75_DREPO|nr:hypothetical protein DPMN_048192 [Dreissena polymorpha]
MEEPSHLYTATPIKEPVLTTESKIPAREEETSLPETPFLEERTRPMQEKQTLQQRALQHVTWGCMPLVPSARRNWDRLPAVRLQGPTYAFDWPPKDWRLMSLKKKLAMANHMVNLLDSVDGLPVTDPEEMMDKYNFLVLPGPLPQPNTSTERRMRIANYCLLSDMAKGRNSNRLILQMLEQTFGHSDMMYFSLC